MWKKSAATVAAGIGWGVGLADLVPHAPIPDSASRVALALAVVCTGFVMLRCYQRPLGEAYELGYRAGRRDAIVEAERRPVSPIRPAPRGLAAFNRRSRMSDRLVDA